MTWLQNFIYSLLSGAAEVLPISSRAHGILLLKIFGASGNSDLMLLMMHLGILLALYKTCRPQLTRINRALALARIPNKKRRRPLAAIEDHGSSRNPGLFLLQCHTDAGTEPAGYVTAAAAQWLNSLHSAVSPFRQ